MTIEEVDTEYYRIEKLLGETALPQRVYNAYCKVGFSAYLIKRDLGLTYNEMKAKIGAEKTTTGNTKGGCGKPSPEIYCRRGEGGMISAKNCLPGCNDACLTCEHKQVDNVGAGGETLTPEESKDSILDGVYGSSSSIAVDEGHSEI